MTRMLGFLAAWGVVSGCGFVPVGDVVSAHAMLAPPNAITRRGTNAPQSSMRWRALADRIMGFTSWLQGSWRQDLSLALAGKQDSQPQEVPTSAHFSSPRSLK